MTRFSRPPFTRIPIPNAGYWSSNAGADRSLLSWTQLPAITASRCGASRSESSVFGTIPPRLFRHSEFTTRRSPPAFVPE